MNADRQQEGIGDRGQSLMTPEGVAIRVEVATLGRRGVAFGIDFLCITGLLFLLLFFLAFISTAYDSDGVGEAFGIVLWFLLLNFYFPLFEGLKGGRTPGKMLTKIRVIDRSGATLSLKAVFTRNFMRDLELWLPLKLILFNSVLMSDLPDWSVPFAILWAVLLLFFPLFNGRRFRLGDLVAGTMVVDCPRVSLLKDLAAPVTIKRQEKSALAFTKEHLGVYGVYELQVLEEILRQRPMAKREVLDSVVSKIKSKISFDRRTDHSSREFLAEFYRAQRAHLEGEMALGRKKLDKFDA